MTGTLLAVKPLVVGKFDAFLIESIHGIAEARGFISIKTAFFQCHAIRPITVEKGRIGSIPVKVTVFISDSVTFTDVDETEFLVVKKLAFAK